MSDVSFEETFLRILRKSEKKKKREQAKAKKEKKREPNLGNTENGRAQCGGSSQVVVFDMAYGDLIRGTYCVREYKGKPGASKGRGPSGGIRK